MNHLPASLVTSLRYFSSDDTALCGLDLCRGTLHGGTLWDKLVFKNVQQGLGGNLRFIATGSAPLSASVMDFTRIATAAPVSRVPAVGLSESWGQ